MIPLQVHPRTLVVEEVRSTFTKFLLDLMVKHEMTYFEAISMLANEMAGLSKYALRRERHPYAPHKGADEAPDPPGYDPHVPSDDDEPAEPDLEPETPPAPALCCTRTACRLTLSDNTVAYHIDTKEPYCFSCMRKINDACGRRMVRRPGPRSPFAGITG